MEGIASLVDTMFLIVLAALASAILFYTGSTYGKTVLSHLDQLFVDYYAKQVLRVLTAVSIKRGGGYDYLLAYLKEKTRTQGYLDVEAAEELRKNLEDALRPIGRAYDYVLYFDFGDSMFAITKIREVKGTRLNTYCCVCDLDSEGRDKLLNWIAGMRKAYAAATFLFFPVKEGENVVYRAVETKLVLWPAGYEGDRIGEMRSLCRCDSC